MTQSKKRDHAFTNQVITRNMCENVLIKTQTPVHFLVIPKSPKPGINDTRITCFAF